MIKSLAITLLFVSSAEAATPHQFNLDCAGERTQDNLQNPGQIIKQPWQAVFSVDLDANHWCQRPACHAIKISGIYANGIALRSDPPPLDFPSVAVDVIFNPKDMGLEVEYWHFKDSFAVSATCKYTPFESLESKK